MSYKPHFAIDIITDLAAILLECKVNGSVDLHDLEPFDTSSRIVKIIATSEDYELLNKILADFSKNPLEYDLYELVPQEDMLKMAEICESLKQELLSWIPACWKQQNLSIKLKMELSLMRQLLIFYINTLIVFSSFEI